MLEKYIINILNLLVGAFIGGLIVFIFGKKQDKISFQRMKRDERYKQFTDLIIKLKDGISVYFTPGKMLYINFSQDAHQDFHIAKLYNIDLHNELFILNRKLESFIVDYGAYFKIENYDFSKVDFHVENIHNLEVMLDNYIKSKTQVIEFSDISKKFEEIKKEHSSIIEMLLDMYFKTQSIFKADQK